MAAVVNRIRRLAAMLLGRFYERSIGPLLIRAPDRIGDEDRSILVDVLGQRIVGKAIGTVKVDEIAQLPKDEPRRHGESGAAHVPDHHLLPEHSRSALHFQGLGQAAALVELDVDDVIPTRTLAKLGEVEDAFVRSNRDSRLPIFQFGLFSARRAVAR